MLAWASFTAILASSMSMATKSASPASSGSIILMARRFTKPWGAVHPGASPRGSGARRGAFGPARAAGEGRLPGAVRRAIHPVPHRRRPHEDAAADQRQGHGTEAPGVAAPVAVVAEHEGLPGGGPPPRGRVH